MGSAEQLKAESAEQLAAIAAALGIPVRTFFEQAADGTGADHPAIQAREMAKLFSGISDRAARARCLDLVRAVAEEARTASQTDTE